MNPFEQKHRNIDELIMDWDKMYPKPYDKNEVDPYTKTRVILMNGTEFEANWFLHQFSRNCENDDLRRELAMLRRLEQQQQKLLSVLKPIDESILEHTIGYEQLAVDLTAHLAQREPDQYVKKALDFALLEDFDHLYRYADLLEMDAGIKAEKLVGKYTEIMPGRPTISHHRYPKDDVKDAVNFRRADLQTKLAVNIITAAEQQTMNYYMNVCGFYCNDIGRRLYQEIGMIEEQHVTHYGCLLDPSATWLENLVLHQYTEAYLYWSCAKTEPDNRIRRIWEDLFEQEKVHLALASHLLEKMENKDAASVIGAKEFPAPLTLTSNIGYVRDVLKGTVQHTAVRESYAHVDDLRPNSDFFRYQRIVNNDTCNVASHKVIEMYIDKNGKDYRFETAPNPIPALRDRNDDNTSVGRVPGSV